MKDINATVILNLEQSPEEILKNLHKDARWGINKAKNAGLIVKETGKEDDEMWKKFYWIYNRTILGGGATPESLEALKEKIGVLFICQKDGKIIAGAGINLKGDYDASIPQLFANASLREHLDSQPNNLLYWACILWCKRKGYRKFDFGGWQINARGHLAGINKFKEKWGEVVYYCLDYPVHIALGRKLIRNSRLFWWLNKKLRGRT